MTIPKEIHDIGITDRWIHMLIVAGSGFGKTVFSGTAERALFLTTDPEGTDSAFAMGSVAKEWEITKWNEGLVKAYQYLRDGGIEELGLKWVLIDNATEAQSIGMKETMVYTRKGKPHIDEFVPQQMDYQRSQNMLREMVLQFHDLPINVLWTAWPKIETDADGDPYWTAGIHGQQGFLAEQITGYMNVVGMGEVIHKNGKEVRRIHFTHEGPFRGKDRFIALGAHRDDLTVPKMEALIQAKVKERRALRAAAKKTTTRSTTTRTTSNTPTKVPARRRVIKRSK